MSTVILLSAANGQILHRVKGWQANNETLDRQKCQIPTKWNKTIGAEGSGSFGSSNTTYHIMQTTVKQTRKTGSPMYLTTVKKAKRTNFLTQE